MNKHRFLRHFPCPVCGTGLKITASRIPHPMFKEQYASCPNPFCNASFLLRTEVVKTISPPAPWQDSKHLPQQASAEELGLGEQHELFT